MRPSIRPLLAKCSPRTLRVCLWRGAQLEAEINPGGGAGTPDSAALARFSTSCPSFAPSIQDLCLPCTACCSVTRRMAVADLRKPVRESKSAAGHLTGSAS